MMHHIRETLSLHNQQANDQLPRFCFERMIYFGIRDANGLLLSFILGAYSLVKLLWWCGWAVNYLGQVWLSWARQKHKALVAPRARKRGKEAQEQTVFSFLFACSLKRCWKQAFCTADYFNLCYELKNKRKKVKNEIFLFQVHILLFNCDI